MYILIPTLYFFMAGSNCAVQAGLQPDFPEPMSRGLGLQGLHHKPGPFQLYVTKYILWIYTH